MISAQILISYPVLFQDDKSNKYRLSLIYTLRDQKIILQLALNVHTEIL